MHIGSNDMSRHKNFALVSGLLRDELEFKCTFKRLLELREAQVISGIVLSTWEGELDKYCGFKTQLLDHGVSIVEGRMPPPSWGNTWAQTKALDQALRIIPDDAMVLKLRTDRTSHLLKAFLPLLETGPVAATNFGALEPIFSHKIHALAVVASLPFYAADTAYYGLKSDLENLVRYDSRFDAIFHGFGPEYRLWTQPFHDKFPELGSVYEKINPRGLSTLLVEAAQRNLSIPDAIIHLYTFYWANLYNNISIVDKHPYSGESVGINQTLSGSSSGIRTGFVGSQTFSVKVAVFNNQDVLRRLMTNSNIGSCINGEKFAEYK
ncbi:MAG: hypothetical protein AB3N18_09845, partial [Allomuricauda sp.]